MQNPTKTPAASAAHAHKPAALLLALLPSIALAGCLDESAGGMLALDGMGATLPLGKGGAGGAPPLVNGGAGGAQPIDEGGKGGAGGSVVVDPGSPGAPTFRAQPCWFQLPGERAAAYDSRCGTVTVPENRAAKGGRNVQLYVAVISNKKTPTSKPDPVVYLDGGPGGAGVYDTVGLLGAFGRFVDEGRELVAIDQRGTGDSLPSLVCSEDESLQTCRDRLAAKADIGQYNTVTNADDIEDVRRALGYKSWNLLGASYGTRLALEVMRRHPAGLRSVILDSVVPPDVNTLSEVAYNFSRTLSELEAACNRHATCGRAYPNLGQRVAEIYTAPAFTFTAGSRTVSVSGTEVLRFLRSLSYSYSALADLPELIERLRERDEKLFRDIFTPSEADPDERPFADGMHYSVRCAENIPIATEPKTEMVLATLAPMFRPFFAHESFAGQLCPIWNVPAAAPETAAPIKSDIPTLVLSGHFDPATPPYAADRVFATLTNASNFVVKDGSHGNFFRACAVPTVRAFLDAPSNKPTWGCPTAEPTVAFKVPPHRLPGATTSQLKKTLPADDTLADDLKAARAATIAPWAGRD